MILVADSGSSKTNWALIENKKTTYYNTEGYNPYYMDTAYIVQSLVENFESASDRLAIEKVYFYGAGCSPERKHIISIALQICFENAGITVESDLLAAARCLLGNKRGFIAILGTGTNSCYFDGVHIAHSIDSLGFLAGDEGSGAYLGKQLIKAYVRGYMPTSLSQSFGEIYGLDAGELITELYTSKSPNKFSAKFSLFAGQNRTNEFIKEMVKYAFSDFFSQIMAHYSNYKGHEISFVGSVAFEFQDLLKKVALGHHMKVSKVVKAPLERLIEYHTPMNTNAKDAITGY